MNRHFELRWGFRHLFIDPRRWQHEHESSFWLRDYEVLDLWNAQGVLERVARQDKTFLHDLGRGVLRDYASINPLNGGYENAYIDRRLLDGLKRLLGHRHEHGEPPAFAELYVCRRKHVAYGRAEGLPDPSKEVREAIAAAEQAPRGFVIVETVNEDGKPIPHVRLEILLADGQVLTRVTGANGQMRLDPIPQGRCTVRLPDLDGSSWRPAEGSGSSRVDKGHKRLHVVAKGDNLTRIAQQYGIQGWKKLWDAPDNERLRKKRKSPHVLYPGDEVVIPGIEIHEIIRNTDQTHRIILTESLVEFRVVLQDHNQLPFADEAYELRVDSNAEPRTGTTDASGKLLEQLPASARRVEVRLAQVDFSWNFALSAFRDRPQEDAAVQQGDKGAVQEAVMATQMRLNALGFPCGEADGRMGPKTREALALVEQQEQPSDDQAAGEVALAALDRLEPMYTGVA